MGEVAVWSPDCMDADDWADWQRMNPVLPKGTVDRPCADCPIGYAIEMRAIGKCNGTPAGVEDDEEVPMTLPASSPGIVRDVPVTAALPCARCAHYAVCRIRPALEAKMETFPVAMPPMDPAITVRLSATVECGQFLKSAGKVAAKIAGGPTPIKRTMSTAQREAIAAGQAARRERERAAATA